MSVYNTTYNFNQGNMNFGEALLYGAFGSLTGGMGCFGGGYGMGMGGSLFSMMGMGMGGYGCGFGGYGMGMYASDSMIGAQVGLMSSNIIINGVSQYIQSRGKGGNDTQSLSSSISKVEDDAKKHIDILNAEGKNYTFANSNFLNAKVEDKYTSELKKADKAISDKIWSLSGDIIRLGDKPTEVPLNENETKESTTYKQRLEKAQNEWQEAKDKIDAEIKVLSDKKDSSNPLVKAFVEAQEAIDNRQAAINNAVDALKPLKEKYDNLVNEQKKQQEANYNAERNNAINGVDGNSLSRTKASKVKEKFDNGSNDYDENDVQGALAAFKNAKTDGDKKYWHNVLHKMCQDSNLMNNINSNISKIVKKYFSNEYDQ